MHKAFSAAAAGVALALCGCGGGGGSDLDQQTGPANPLTGYYGGQGTETGTTDSQFARIGVSGDGTLCGTIYDQSAMTRATLGGEVSATGQISQGSILYQDRHGGTVSRGALSGQITGLNGTTGGGGVSAIFTATVSSSTVTYTFPTLAAPVRHARKRRKAAASQSQSSGG